MAGIALDDYLREGQSGFLTSDISSKGSEWQVTFSKM